ncbi:hypothetical protein ABZY93_22010 [Streptomyces smyrnaeus]|uniref:hypothetical protein n=1 Tax=Streptomyces smyrnaeus TaxID=1387713 RepID=UPI0033B1B095
MRELSVTIKYDKGHDATWAVFKGSPGEVREDIIDYFGFDRDSVAGLTLNQLALNVTQVAHGGSNAAASLGAVALPASADTPTPGAPADSEDPWTAAGQPAAPAASTQPEGNSIFKLIEECTTIDGLKKLWASNQSAFSDSKVMEAYKVKGRALKSAS